MTSFTGTGVAVVTPFDQQGRVDEPALARIIEHLIAGGVEYLVVLGTTGEAATLSGEEQSRVIETFFEVNEGRLPIVLGVGGNNTQLICKSAEALSKRYQPSGLLSVSPYYNKPSQEGIYQHYKAVAASTDLPIIIYNVPGRTASNITADTCLRLAHEVDNIVAIKEASGNLEQGMDIVAGKPDGFQVLSGDDALSLALIACGYTGVISVTANAMPRAFSDMVRAALAGEIERARGLHYTLWPLMEQHFAEGNPAGVKATMELLGLCTREVRLPLIKASEALIERIKKGLITK